MAEVTIKYSESWGDCETCGSYADERLVVTADGKEVIDLRHDGHLGRGDDLSDPVEVVRRVLGALGHAVVVCRE